VARHVLGFGFLTFDSEDNADAVVKEHFVQINGKQVRRSVEFATCRYFLLSRTSASDCLEDRL